MKYNPLLVPHMLNLGPVDQSYLMNGNYAAIRTAFIRNLQSTIVGDCIEPREIGGLRFSDGKLAIYDSGNSPTSKMQNRLIGCPIDVYGEIPFANRTRITGFEKSDRTSIISFECEDEYVSVRDLPRHTDESIKARRRRMGFEALFSIKTHWMTRALLNRLTSAQILKIDPTHYLQHNAAIIIGKSVLPKNDPLTEVTLSPSGASPDLVFGNKARVTSCAISIEGRYPEVFAEALVGGTSRRVIDHWIFEGSKINKTNLNKSSTRITFSSPSRTRSYAEDEPDRVADVMARLRRAEAKHTPQSVKDWDAKVQALDAERQCDPCDRFSLMHIFRTASGETRSGRVRI